MDHRNGAERELTAPKRCPNPECAVTRVLTKVSPAQDHHALASIARALTHTQLVLGHPARTRSAAARPGAGQCHRVALGRTQRDATGELIHALQMGAVVRLVTQARLLNRLRILGPIST